MHDVTAGGEGVGSAVAVGVVEALAQLVEDVVVALPLVDVYEARLLEQEVVRLRADDDVPPAVLEPDVLSESARVVVAHRLGVPERL